MVRKLILQRLVVTVMPSRSVRIFYNLDFRRTFRIPSRFLSRFLWPVTYLLSGIENIFFCLALLNL